MSSSNSIESSSITMPVSMMVTKSVSPSTQSTMLLSHQVHSTTLPSPVSNSNQSVDIAFSVKNSSNFNKRLNSDHIKYKRSANADEALPVCRPFEEGDNDTKTFYSPNHPFNYPNKTTCTRVITGKRFSSSHHKFLFFPIFLSEKSFCMYFSD